MDYEYKDQHFSVEIAEALLTQATSTHSNIGQIKKYLLDTHRKKGGFGRPDSEDSEDEDIFDAKTALEIDIVVQALQNLTQKAKVNRIHKDIWRIARPDQWIFGKGKHWIYLYYFPQEKRDAEEKGSSVFPCKIGKADGVDRKGKIKYDAPEKRVEDLTRGAREFAKIPLLLRTDTHAKLEKTIHNHLELQGKSIPNRPSTEWFLTNPRDVVNIVAGIKITLLHHAYNFPAIFADMK